MESVKQKPRTSKLLLLSDCSKIRDFLKEENQKQKKTMNIDTLGTVRSQLQLYANLFQRENLWTNYGKINSGLKVSRQITKETPQTALCQ